MWRTKDSLDVLETTSHVSSYGVADNSIGIYYSQLLQYPLTSDVHITCKACGFDFLLWVWGR
jgi:hypothetical protein